MKNLIQFKLRRSNRLLVGIGKFLVELLLFGAISRIHAQGLVNFTNTPETLISANDNGIISAINGPVGSYYFGLLTANPGTTDPRAFVFTGIYATNVIDSGPGRISGGTEVRVPGWAVGTMRSFMVCGWDAKGGTTFNSSWLIGPPPIGMSFSMSPIATGIAGGFDSQTEQDLPALNIFGADTIWSGFALPVEGGCLSCPRIGVQPQDQSATVGMTVRFVVRVLVDPHWLFQWFCNGVAIPGATHSVLEIPNVALSQNGNRYYVTVSGPGGPVTSAQASLTVTPAPGLPVEVRPVPGLTISGQQGISLEVKTSGAIRGSGLWSTLQNLILTANQNWCFDVSGSSTPHFYRTQQSLASGDGTILELHMVPAITLNGAIGSHVQIDYVNQLASTNSWSSLTTVLLTNSPQLYFDTSAVGQPPRIYSLIPQ